MHACVRCGFGNQEAAQFCGNPDCRADLRPAVAPGRGNRPPPTAAPYRPPVNLQRMQPRPAAPPPTWRPEPQPAAPAPQAPEQTRGIRLTMEPAELRVEPGATTSTTVKVRNRGTQVERIRLDVGGPVANLGAVNPPELSVFPGDEQSAEVRFTVPRASWPPAGRAPFQVLARSEVHPDVGATEQGALSIGRFDQIVPALDPEMTRGRLPGQHRVTVVNHGNAPVTASVAFADRDGELSYSPAGMALELAPGATQTGTVAVGGVVKWFGRVQSLPFTATVTSNAAPQPTLLNGVRRQVPRFPWWIPTAIVVIIALLIALLALLGQHQDTVPGVAGKDAAAAATILQDAGYTASQIQVADPAIPAGQAVKTDPAVGSAFKKGGLVQLFVSVGPCATGPCPIKIPNVVGLSLAAAQAQLTAAQFTVERVNRQPDPQQPADTVLSSAPGPNEQAEHGSAVVLTASSGPAAPPPLTSLSGLSVANATAKLQSVGLVAAMTPVHTNQAPAGTVIGIDPAVGTQLVAGSTVTLKVAQPTAVIDMLALAPTAAWVSTDPNDPQSPFHLTFPGDPGDGSGFVLIDPADPNGPPAMLEDGSAARVLETHPYWGAGGTITGSFVLPAPIIAGDHVMAKVGFLAGSNDSVTFVVSAGGKEIKRVNDSGNDGRIRTMDADLSPAAGASDVEITVLAGVRGDLDLAVWKDLRIEPQIG